MNEKRYVVIWDKRNWLKESWSVILIDTLTKTVITKWNASAISAEYAQAECDRLNAGNDLNAENAEPQTATEVVTRAGDTVTDFEKRLADLEAKFTDYRQQKGEVANKFHNKIDQLERRAKNAESLSSKWQQQITELWYAVRKLGYVDEPDSELSRTKRALEYAKSKLSTFIDSINLNLVTVNTEAAIILQDYVNKILARIQRIEEGKQEVSDGLTK